MREERDGGRGRDLVVICRTDEGSLHRPPGWLANELSLTKGNSFTGALSIVVIQRRGRDLWTLISVEDRRIVSTNGRVRQTNCKIPRGSLLPTPTLPRPPILGLLPVPFRFVSFHFVSFRSFFATGTRLFVPFFSALGSILSRSILSSLCRTESDEVSSAVRGIDVGICPVGSRSMGVVWFYTVFGSRRDVVARGLTSLRWFDGSSRTVRTRIESFERSRRRFRRIVSIIRRKRDVSRKKRHL